MRVKRFILSLLIGFFLGAVTAGVLEATGFETIAFESLPALALVVFWTILAWYFLSARD